MKRAILLVFGVLVLGVGASLMHQPTTTHAAGTSTAPSSTMPWEP